MQGNAAGQSVALEVLGEPDLFKIDTDEATLTRIFTQDLTGKQRVFLAVFAGCGNLNRAARTIGTHPNLVYTWRHESDQFEEAFEKAWKMALDRVEAECFRRAVEGTDKPIFHKGEQVGSIREYSDTLAMFLLRGGRPERYTDRFKGEITGDTDLLDRLMQGRKRAASIEGAIDVVATEVRAAELAAAGQEGIGSTVQDIPAATPEAQGGLPETGLGVSSPEGAAREPGAS